MSSERQIEDRLRGRLTGPTGEADFIRCAADDLEWCLMKIGEANAAVRDADASRFSAHADAAVAEEKLRKEREAHEDTKRRLLAAKARISELEGPEAAE